MKEFKYFLFIVFFCILTFSFNTETFLPVSEITISDTCQLSAEIDGKKIEFIEGIGKIRNGSSVIKNFKKPPDSSSYIFQSYLFKYPAGQTEIAINIGTLYCSGLRLPDSVFQDFIKIRKYEFSKYAENGIEIIHHDKKANLWKTSQGNQDESTFEITDIVSDSLYIKFKAIFNCKLYNSEGKIKDLKNGIYIGYFENK